MRGEGLGVRGEVVEGLIFILFLILFLTAEAQREQRKDYRIVGGRHPNNPLIL